MLHIFSPSQAFFQRIHLQLSVSYNRWYQNHGTHNSSFEETRIRFDLFLTSLVIARWELVQQFFSDKYWPQFLFIKLAVISAQPRLVFHLRLQHFYLHLLQRNSVLLWQRI